MLTITRERRSGIKHDYIIYEPGDVIPASLRVVPYGRRHSAMKGELVTDINGRMVPLLRRVTVNKSRHQIMMIFPGYCWQPWKMDVFSFPVEKAAEPDHSRILSPRVVSFAGLLATGMPIEAALASCWPKVPVRRSWVLVRRLFANNEFVSYLLVELGYVDTLKEALEKRGITTESLAGEIADLIQDGAANPTLKRWALETALAVVEKPTKTPMVQNNVFLGPGGPSEAAAIDRVMADRLRLPSASEDLPSPMTEAAYAAMIGGDADASQVGGDIEG